MYLILWQKLFLPDNLEILIFNISVKFHDKKILTVKTQGAGGRKGFGCGTSSRDSIHHPTPKAFPFPIGDKMHNWAFQIMIGDLGLEIGDWKIGCNMLA